MTSTVSKEFTCSVCGATSEHEVVVATSQVLSTDMDTRPGFPKRNILDYSVQACPNCGYCSGTISTPIEGTAEVIRSEAYQRQLVNPEFPDLANKYLCHAIINEKAGDLENAGWACIHTAWACDDAGKDKAASKNRLRAVKLLLEAETETPEQVGVDNVILADLLRRAGAFEKARVMCEEGLKKVTEEIIGKCLRFEMELIGWEDNGCYNMDYVLEPGSEPPRNSGLLLPHLEHNMWLRRKRYREEIQERRRAKQGKKPQTATCHDGGEFETEENLSKGKFE